MLPANLHVNKMRKTFWGHHKSHKKSHITAIKLHGDMASCTINLNDLYLKQYFNV